jgi:hypothetical protein
MAGGLIQLVATGLFDLFLTHEPQITFFKVVYRRHTNFSTETILQDFTHVPDFGRRVTCILSRNGDLMRKMYLVVDLPSIPQFKDDNNNLDSLFKFAWTRRIGYALINRIEVEIGGELMDRQYGDWLNIWDELTVADRKDRKNIIGDVPEVIDFSNGKKTYRLIIPLQFWFNRVTGLALPIVAMQYQHVKVNLEIAEFNTLRLITPTHVINIDNDFVNFDPLEVITQTVDGVTSTARFIQFDIVNRQMYLWRFSDNGFLSLTETDLTKIQTEADQDAILYARNPDGTLVNAKYLITGEQSKFQAMPRINAAENLATNTSVDFDNIVLKNAFLLVEYVYLDEEERVRFSQARHEYLMEQVLFNGEKTVNGLRSSYKLGFTQPCKEVQWVTQLSLAQRTRLNQHFNYTNSVLNTLDNDAVFSNIILEETLLFNGQPRISFRDSEYFSYVQVYQNHSHSPNEGINVYSFALHPEKHQPSCTSNMSRLDNVQLQILVGPGISFENTAKLRIYGIVYNILRVANGISGLVFSNDRET